jgi:uncharacterized protein (DUF1697 family)
MSVLVALLRGINVGGRNTLPMRELVSILEASGARNVETYVQSGNAVFEFGGRSVSGLAKKLTAAIEEHRGFEPYVLLLDRNELESAAANNPFPEAESDPAHLHLGFLAGAPRRPDLNKLDELKKTSERYRLIRSVFYLHAPEGIGRSKLAASSERLLGVTMTVRNWRTVCRLRDLADR